MTTTAPRITPEMTMEQILQAAPVAPVATRKAPGTAKTRSVKARRAGKRTAKTAA